MQEEFTWKGAIIVFWALAWRFLIGALVVGFIVGLALGGVFSAMGVEKEVAMNRANITGQLLAIPIFIFVIKRLFTKGFGKYRLSVVEK